MHAEPTVYKEHTILPLAVGAPGSFAAMVIITSPDGIRWPSGVLGYLETETAACHFAIQFAEWDINGRRGDRPTPGKMVAPTRARALTPHT